MTKHNSTTYNGICCKGCFKLGIKEGKSLAITEYIKEIDEFISLRTYQNMKELPALVKFMPFEWEELKAKLQAMQEKQ